MSKLALIWSAITAGGAAATTGVLVATGVIDIDRIFSKQEMAPAPLVSSEGAPKTTTAPAPEKVAVAQPSENAAEPPAEEAQPAKEKAPSFDIVRVEPSGDAVVAGQSEPGAIVALLSDGKVVGKTVADGSGAWTVVLEKPLDPGDHDISATTMGPTGSPKTESEEHVAVSVPKDESEELLVVMSKPGEPTKVLQKPVEAVEKPVETADKPAEQPKDETPVVVAASEPEDPATPVAQAPKTEPAAPAPEQPVAVAATEQATETPQLATEAKPEETSVAAVEPATQPPAAAETPISEEPSAAPIVTEAQKPVEEPAGATVAVAVAEPPAETPAAPVVHYNVTVEAVEVEDGKLYVAGAGTPGTTVRIYIDGKIVGHAEVNEAGRWLMQTQKSLDAGKYVVRADQVTDEEGTVVARAEVPFEREPDVISLTPLTVASGGSGGDSGTLTIREVPSVIIRKGDNLWRISRRRYGHGIRYTTIYGANRKQIRNPHLIYPGQVFLVPEGDVSWKTN